MKFCKKIFAHYCELSSVIPLYINPYDSIMAYLDRPYKFCEIAKDSSSMILLKDFLEQSPYAPNLNKWYYICKREDRRTWDTIYYLKKASEDDVARLLKTR